MIGSGFPDSPYVWKIIADALALSENFHLENLQLKIPALLVSQNADMELSREDVLELSLSCFCKVVRISADCQGEKLF